MIERTTSYDERVGRAARRWHRRFENPLPARRPTIDIHANINKRSDASQTDPRKAVRGTGEGFWGREQRDQRTDKHVTNWESKGARGSWETADPSISRIGAPNHIPKSPYELSTVHVRTRRASTENENIAGVATQAPVIVFSEQIVTAETQLPVTPVDADFNVPLFQGIPNPDRTDFIDGYTNVAAIATEIKSNQ